MRVELGEIEAALLALPEVAAAVAEVRGERSGGERLVAYLVPLGPVPDGLVAVARRRLEELLPPPMVPQDFVLLEALPLGVHGKVDRLSFPGSSPPPPRPLAISWILIHDR